VGKLPLKIIVFQQNNSGESKIAGIRKFGEGRFDLHMISIDIPLPPVIDDAREFLPADIDADLVLDFLKHPDLSYDLARLCRDKGIPVVASGKKLKYEGVATPPT
jgi:thymidylate synthase